MNNKVKTALKWTYNKSLEFGVARRLRKTAKKAVKVRRVHRYNKLNKEAFASIKDLSAEEANVKVIDLDHKSEVFAFGYDMLGCIKDLEAVDYIEFASALEGILENDDIDIRLAFAEKEEIEKNPEALAYFEKKLKLRVISPGDAILVNNGEVKALFMGTQFKRYLDEGEKPEVGERALKQLAFAKAAGAATIVCYGLREFNSVTKMTKSETRFVRELANLGVNEFYGIDEFGIHKGWNVERLNGTYANAVASMGCLFGCKDNDITDVASNTAVAVRVKMLRLNKEQPFVRNRGYIPLFVSFTGKYEPVIRIDYHNVEHRGDDEVMAAQSYLERHMPPMRDIRNLITIQDICDVLEIELPEKYADYANISVNKVCARSFEVSKGDVLFFREPFNDPNDKEPQPLEVRKRIVDKSMDRGARFVFSYADLDPDIPHIKVDNCREAHIKVCAYLRTFYEVRTIGITGSIGKTSTKDMLYNVMRQKYRTYRNLRNSNTQVNIGMHIQDFTSDYEIFIQEIGGGRPGGASRHSRMIAPSATVVTNIGQAHIGNFGTQEKLMESKLGIIDGMDENGVLYLNADDPLLRTAKVDAKTVFFAVHNREADYYAENVIEEAGTTCFDIVHGDHRVPAKLNVLGEYNVLNAVCCYAIGKQFELTDEQIVNGLLEFETSGTRQNLISVGGYNLFVDCFNASPASVESSLSVLDAIETDHKKIAVLGDVTGMADLSEEMHGVIGDIVIKHHPDKILCYGEESKKVCEIAQAHGMNAVSITKPAALVKELKDGVNVGDVVLFKGSSKTRLSERIDEIYGTMLSDQRYIDSHKYKRIKFNGLFYNVYENYASLIQNTWSARTSVRVSRKMRGVPVYAINDAAFADLENLTNVDIPSTVRHIGEGCFSGCGALTSIDFSKGVIYIGANALADCTSLKQIKLGNHLIHIADGAFKNCMALESLYIPPSVTAIGEDVFVGCESIVVSCKKGSYAEQYCIDRGIEYVLK